MIKNNLENIIRPTERKRIIVIVGHYGSGKTEFAVNLALGMKKICNKVALLDMDIANPYFRSRERQSLLTEKGVDVYYNTFGFDITEDLPAISAAMRGPMEDPSYITIVDVGGNDSGARILKQFNKYFSSDDAEILCVLNANRPETDTLEGMLFHIESIQTETELKISGIINNTHLLMETKACDILNGYGLCIQAAKHLGIPVVWNTCNEKLIGELVEELNRSCNSYSSYSPSIGSCIDWEIIPMENIYPIKLYMRPSWLDR